MIASSLLAAAILGILISLILLFLPAIIELRHPQDAGPRVIAETNFLKKPTFVLTNIEGETVISPQNVSSLLFLHNAESIPF
jgi:hypothetical protein